MAAVAKASRAHDEPLEIEMNRKTDMADAPTRSLLDRREQAAAEVARAAQEQRAVDRDREL
jgi:hypothetical protein